MGFDFDFDVLIDLDLVVGVGKFNRLVYIVVCLGVRGERLVSMVLIMLRVFLYKKMDFLHKIYE